MLVFGKALPSLRELPTQCKVLQPKTKVLYVFSPGYSSHITRKKKRCKDISKNRMAALVFSKMAHDLQIFTLEFYAWCITTKVKHLSKNPFILLATNPNLLLNMAKRIPIFVIINPRKQQIRQLVKIGAQKTKTLFESLSLSRLHTVAVLFVRLTLFCCDSSTHASLQHPNSTLQIQLLLLWR